MKKLILFFGFLAVGVLGDQIQFLQSYHQAMETAAEKGKPVLMMMVTSRCPWCMRMKERTLPDPKVTAKINANYIPVMINRDEDPYPEELYAKLVPTIYYIDPKDGELLYETIGYKSPALFLEDLEEGLVEFRAHAKDGDAD